ncbi:MAG: ferritin [Candidatus Cloacimonadota bacterium]|nr:MAG: ferritin [Candidatus Cloacimonadota bacterium]
MLTESMLKAINEQLNFEMYSANVYLSMSAYFKRNALNGFADWMKLQAQEEFEHAMKIFDYISAKGGKIEISSMDAPQSEWTGPLNVMQYTLIHEQEVTNRINNLFQIAHENNDHSTSVFFHWFIEEQVQEEAQVNEVIDKLILVGDSSHGIFMIDDKMGLRTNAV